MRVPNGADSDPDLPAGWASVALDDLGYWLGGGTPSTDNQAFWKRGTIPWVSPKDMKASRITDTQDHITEQAVSASAASIVPAGAVLIVTRSGILRHSLPVAVLSVDAALNQDLKALVLSDGLDSEYVAAALRAFAGDILKRCTKHGTTVHSVEFPRLKGFCIPVAPTNEQRRIVAKVQELLSQLDAGVANLKRARALLEKYRQAVLKAAVTGELTREWREKRGTPAETGAELLQRILKARREAWEVAELAKMQARGKAPKDDRWKQRYTEPKPASSKELPALPDGWVWATVDCISLYVTDGDHNPPQRVEHGVPHLTARNVRNWTLNLSGCSFVSYDGFGQTRARYEPRKDDIIITCVGTIGRTAIVRENFIFSADRNLAAIRVVPQSVSISYIHYILNTPLIQDWMQRASGSTAQPHLYLNDLRRVPVPLPSVCEQHKIVELLDEQLSDLNVVEAEIAKLQQRSATTSQSILRSAFSGRLVPQNACDEPAGILLERIRAERAERPVSGRRRGHTKKPSTASAGQLELMP